MRPLAIIVTLIFLTSSVQADCLDEAVNLADKVCGQIQKSGSSSIVEANGSLKAEISGIVRRALGSGGGEISGKMQSEAYENVLRVDLSKEVFDARHCRMKMIEVGRSERCKVSKPSPDKNPPINAANLQAAKVSGWAKIIRQGIPQATSITYEIKIKNSSDQPIYDAEATLYIDKTEMRGPVNFHIIAAGETETITMDTSWPTNKIRGLGGYIDYKFKDSRGKKWHRDFEGHLYSIK